MSPTDTGPTPDVWHLIAPAPFGGAESVVATLATSRQRAGRPTGVILLAPPGLHPFAERLSSAGVPVVRIPVRGRDYRRQALAVTEVIGDQPCVLHTHGYQGDVVGWWAARTTDAILVATNHGYVGGSLKNRTYEWIDRRVLRRFDAVIAVSTRNAERLLASGQPSSRLVVVPNGWSGSDSLPAREARRRLGLSDGLPVVGWVGRLSHEKGIDQLLEAVAACRDIAFRVVVVGDGPERAAAETYVAAQGLEDCVRFLGARPAAAAEASAFDVLAISSRSEGLPMVMLEAIGAGAAIVAFAVGGIPEVLDADSAWLVPPGDVQALADALRQAISAPDEAQRRLHAAQRVINEKLGAERWVQEVESVYDLARERRR